MTPFWRGLNNIWSGAEKHEKIEKVTGSRDDKGESAVSSLRLVTAIRGRGVGVPAGLNPEMGFSHTLYTHRF